MKQLSIKIIPPKYSIEKESSKPLSQGSYSSGYRLGQSQTPNYDLIQPGNYFIQ